MATYAELFTISATGAILDKVTVAVAIQAEVIRNELGTVNNHANRLVWAKQAIADPRTMAQRMLWTVLAQNAAATSAQITGCTDASVLAALAAAVDLFAS